MTKNKRAEINLAPEDLERLQEAAKNAGLSLSSWLLMVALEAARKQKNQST
jgi:uncharacterized protein (DUF1778 family)